MKNKIRILLSLALIFSFEYLMAQPCTVEPKAPKVAIVSAGQSEKVCASNIVELSAQIPEWMDIKWSPASSYSAPFSANTSFTFPAPIGSTTYQIYTHYPKMTIKGIDVNLFSVYEGVQNIFYPSNQNATLSVVPFPIDPTFHLESNDGGFRDYWTTVDGPYANPCLIGGDLFFPKHDGAYTFKSAIPGCSTNFITADCVVTNASNFPPDPNNLCDQYRPRGFIEINTEPVDVLIASNNISGGLVKVYDSNGVHQGTLGNIGSPFVILNAGTYSLVPQPLGLYTTPPPVNIIVGANTDTTVTVNYLKTIPTGRLTVAYTGSCSNQPFAQVPWTLDGVHYYQVGNTIDDLPVGSHTLTFMDAAGYAKPLPVTFTIEENKRTVVFGEYQKYPACGITNFGLSGQVEIDMEAAEAAACDPANCNRVDYHRYNFEKILTTTASATLAQVWDLYKSKKSNQAPLAEDFVPVPGSGNYSQGVRTAFAGALFPLDFGHFSVVRNKKFFEKRQTGCNLMVWKIKKKLPVLP